MNYRSYPILLFLVLFSSCLIGLPDYFHSLDASSSSDDEDENNGELEGGATTTTEPVTWNTFSDPKGSFTIQYPSNWIPTKVPNSPNPIDMDFSYYGTADDFARLGIQKFTTSSYFNSRDALQGDIQFSQNNFTDYTIEKPIECTNYKFGSISACSVNDSWEGEEGRIRSLTISAVDETTGEEYYLFFSSSANLFEHFLPVADYMFKSFKLIS